MKKIFKLLISLVFIQTGFCCVDPDEVEEYRKHHAEQELIKDQNNSYMEYKKTDGDFLNSAPLQEDGSNGDSRLPNKPRQMLRSRSGSSSSSDGTLKDY